MPVDISPTGILLLERYITVDLNLIFVVLV